MYGAMFEGKYTWISEALDGATVGWFPIFNNFLRKNDKVEPYEKETDQAASIFFRSEVNYLGESYQFFPILRFQI